MKYLIAFFFSFPFVQNGQAQGDAFNYSVTPNYIKSIGQNQLKKAETLTDINPGFPASWISTYISTEIIVNNNLIQITKGLNDTLSIEQRNQLAMVDYNSEVKFRVTYLPNNTLSDDTKEIEFVYTLIPETEAEFHGGEDALNHYLKQNILDKIPEQSLKQIDMIEVSFNVSESGEIKNVKFGTQSKDDQINTIILESISQMPNWKPATSSTGLTVSQSFQFRIGTTIGC